MFKFLDSIRSQTLDDYVYPSLTDTILLVEASALIETDSALFKQTRFK